MFRRLHKFQRMTSWKGFPTLQWREVFQTDLHKSKKSIEKKTPKHTEIFSRKFLLLWWAEKTFSHSLPCSKANQKLKDIFKGLPKIFLETVPLETRCISQFLCLLSFSLSCLEIQYKSCIYLQAAMGKFLWLQWAWFFQHRRVHLPHH